MGTGYQANQAKGTRSDRMRPDKVRHTATMTAGLFEAIRAAALAHNRSISEEMVARLTASVAATDPDAGRKSAEGGTGG